MAKHISMKQLTALSLLGSAVAHSAEKPNIIYLFTDQQTAGALSCAGNPDVHTPNLDRLAAAGVRFGNAYCTAPLSGPSRAAMFTGHYPESVGLAVNGASLPESLQKQTLGTLVKEAGYACAYGGKWHLPHAHIPDQLFGFEHLHKHTDDGLAEACVAYLKREHATPFFLVASFDNPHNICEYARNQNLPFGNVATPSLHNCPGLPPNFGTNPYDADVIQWERAANHSIYPTINYTPDDWRMYRHTYYRLVEKVDREIGKIIDAIDQRGLWSNTIVLFSSDHGDGVGAHQWNQKSALYEEVINIPFIVTLPGKRHAGTVMPQLINNGIDLFASICDWAGVHPPKGTAGTSFRNLVESGNPQQEHQPYVITESRFDGSKTRGWVVRTEQYKYVLYDKGRNREQLFDMHNDRGEMRNLAVESAHENQVQKHRDILVQWMSTHHIKPTREGVHDVPGASFR